MYFSIYLPAKNRSCSSSQCLNHFRSWAALLLVLFLTQAVFVQQAIAAGGSYSIKWTAADPDLNKGPFGPTYPKLTPGQLTPPYWNPAPSGGTGRAAAPIPNAIYGNPADSVSSLSPSSMALGQIVPFEVEILVSGSTAPENGTITFSPYFLTKTTSGGNFGFDPTYGVYSAFVDYVDPGHVDPLNNAKVDSYTSLTANPGTSNEQIQGKIQVSGLNSGDKVIVEIWVVLKNQITSGISGNVQTGLLNAHTGTANNPLDTINTGNQTVPLLKVQEFFTASADVSITKSDSPDPVIQGQRLTYSIIVVNHSTDTVANGIVVTDTLDPNTSFVSASGAPYTVSASTITFTVGSLSPLQSLTLTVVVDVSATAPIEGDPSLNPEPGSTVIPTVYDIFNKVVLTAITSDPTLSNNTYYQPTNVLSSFVPNPHISLIKMGVLDMTVVGAADVAEPGDVIHYTITATNDGNVVLTGITISDSLIAVLAPSWPGTPGTLLPGQSVTFTGSYTLTQTDVNLGHVDNTATVQDGTATVSATASAHITLVAAPDVHIEKSSMLDLTLVGPSDLADPGDVINYTITVTNTGTLELTNISVVDSLLTSLTASWPGTPGTLLPGQSATFTGSYVLTQADIEAGYVNNTAMVTAKPSQGPSIQDETTNSQMIVQVPSLSIAKQMTVPPPTMPMAGDTISYIITVTNDGNIILTGVTVSDPLLGSLTESWPGIPGTLLPGESATFTGSYTLIQEDINNGFVSNTATADSDQTMGQDATATESVAQVPYITQAKTGTLDMSVSGASDRADPGDIINYTITVTNNGNVTLTGVTIEDPDPFIGTLSCTLSQPATLAPGESMICSVSYTLTQDDIDNGHVNNTAIANRDQPTEVDTSVTVSIPQILHISQTKEGTLDMTVVAPDDTAQVGDIIDYTIIVSNDGNVTLTGVTVSDAEIGPLTPAWPGPAGELLPGESVVFTGSRVLTQTDIDNGHVNNTAIVYSDQTMEVDTNATVSIPQDLSLAQTKTAALDMTLVAPDDRADVGDVINYTIIVTNDGNVTVTGITVTDPLLGSLTPSWPGTPGTLLPGEYASFSGTYTLTQADIDNGYVNNTAIASGSHGTEPVEIDTSATVSIPQVLHLTQTKTGTLDMTQVAPNDRADAGDVINYTITVTNDGNVTLTNVTVVDPLLGILTVSWPGTPGALLPGESATFSGSYVLVQADINNGHVNNTAIADSDQTAEVDTSATVDIPQVPHLTQTKTGTIDMTQVMPNDRADAGDVINYTITVTNDGNMTLTGVMVVDPFLGSLTATWPGTPGELQPGQSATFAGSYTLKQADIDAGHVINTADADSDQTPETTTPNTTPIPQRPALQITKYVSIDNQVTWQDANSVPGPYTVEGAQVFFKFVVVNIGNVTLSNISVTDNVYGTIGTISSLSPSASQQFIIGPIVVTAGQHSNTATASVQFGGITYWATDSANYRGLPKSMVTNTEYCWFDWCAGTPGEGFRLIFTPDLPANPNLYKLSASNPGQFYYNVFYYGAYNPTTKFTISIPYPFVTMGAMPVHVYNSLGVSGIDPQICLMPGTDITGQFTINPPNSLTTITLSSYSPQAFGQYATITVTPNGSGSGLLYVTVHLNYGLKGTGPYNKDASDNATNPTTGAIVIANNYASNFSVSGLTSNTYVVYNCNTFKRFPGFAGLVTDADGDPLSGVTVEIRGPNSTKLLATVVTDEDGWYLYNYKHTSKPAVFTVTLVRYGLSQSVTLVANKLVLVNFVVPVP